MIEEGNKSMKIKFVSGHRQKTECAKSKALLHGMASKDGCDCLQHLTGARPSNSKRSG
jgi:hypothetical protein